MHRTQTNGCGAAFIFSKDADFHLSTVDKNFDELSRLALGAEYAAIDSEAQTSRAGTPKEIQESMYVVKMLEMIDTVLAHESHLFSPSELNILNRIRAADLPQKFLISRLVQRKHGKWHRADHLLSSYQHDLVKYLRIPEASTPRKLAETLVSLCADWKTGDGPALAPAAPDTRDIIDLTLDSDDDETPPTASNKTPEAVSSGAPVDDSSSICTFAEDASCATPSELLECLTLDELKQVAKRLKVAKTKQARPELIKAILHSSSTQTTLPFTVITKPSSRTPQKGKTDMRQFFVQAPTNKMPLQERRVRDLCSETFGGCFRLRSEVFDILRLVSLVYFRETQYSESESIFLSSILATVGKRNYPRYEYRRTGDIFKTRADMLRYVGSLRLVANIDTVLEGSVGFPTGVKRDSLQIAKDVIELWKPVWDRWNLLVTYYQDKPPCERGLERFEEGHVLTRIMYKAARCFGLLKDYVMELKIRTALIRQTRWRRGKRGGWYDRVALIYTRYMGGGDDSLYKARDILLEGLGDELVHIGSRPQLLRRLRRLEKTLRVPLEDQYNSDEELKTATMRKIEGVRIFTPPPLATQHQHSSTTPISRSKDATTDRYGSVASTSADSKTRDSWKGKSIWAGKEGEVNVENFALEYYATLGFKGMHSEGSIVSTLFALLFWDIMFAPVPGAFETPYQSAPLDMFHDSFISARQDLVNARLAELTDSSDAARRIIQAVDERERENQTWCIGLRWDQFERETLLEIADCLGGRAVATICRLLAEEYANRGGGVPDLFVWNFAERTCKFVEVKGPGDTLSETQKVWIDVLLGAGVDVEVCRVYEMGKIPATRIKQGKAKSRKAGKGGASKVKREPGDPDDEVEQLESSSSEDDGPEDQETRIDDTPAPEDQAPNEPIQDGERGDATIVDGSQRVSSQTADTVSLGRRDERREAVNLWEATRVTKQVRTDRSPSLSQRSAPHPQMKVAPTAQTRPRTPIPAPVPPIKPEPLSPTRTNLTNAGPSLFSIERPSRDALTQETVIPETPLPSQPGFSADSLLAAPRSTYRSKRRCEEIVTPIKQEPQENVSTTNPTVPKPKPSSKRKRSGTPTPARSAPAPPVPLSDNSGPGQNQPTSAEDASRTPHKRACTFHKRTEIATSPRDWEKEWPDVFPRWVGDMADKSSDGDYEPGRSQNESQ